jgi:hypothetical protein
MPIPRRATLVVVAALLLAGCANTFVHDENRDKQGQEAKKLVAEARIADAVAELDKTFANVAALEEARARERAAYLFDLELRVVSRASALNSRFSPNARETDGLRTVVEDRLVQLGLKSSQPDELKKLRALAPRFTARQRALEITLIEFHGTVGHRFEDCDGIRRQTADPDAFLAGLRANRRELARSKLPALIEACRGIDQILQERDKFFNDGKGEVTKLLARLDALQRRLLRYDLEMQSARDELAKASAALRDSGAEAAATPSSTSRLETVESRASRLADVAHGLARGSKALGDAGAHAVAAERLARLEAVLGAIAGTPPDAGVQLSADERVAVAIIRDIPGLADEADKLLSQAQKPRLVPFVAAIDQQRLVLQGFETGRRAKLKEAAAVRSELDAVLEEAGALVKVLEPLARNSDWSQRSIGQLLEGLTGDRKIELLRALAIYADEVKQHRIEAAAWKVRAEGAQYEAGLARSKYAAAQWDALIDTVATVLADYHASGIRKADLAEFFKALGLVTIGVGAAQ